MWLCIYVRSILRRFPRQLLLITCGQEVMVRSHPFRVRCHAGKLFTRGRPVQPDRVHETQFVRVNRFHVDETVFDDRRPDLVSPYGSVQIALKTRAGRSVWPNGRMVVCFEQRSRQKPIHSYTQPWTSPPSVKSQIAKITIAKTRVYLYDRFPVTVFQRRHTDGKTNENILIYVQLAFRVTFFSIFRS